jgi:uncharacterized protein (TIGR03435 family)
MRKQGAAVFVIAMVPVMAAAQPFTPTSGAPVDPNARFEVVSIKPINDANTPMRTMTTPAGLESSNPVGGILRQALQKPDDQMAGAPGWINTERYSIRAKPPAGVPITAMSVMMLNMLKDRFQLVTHPETREQAIFHLVLAHNDGRLGPSVKPTSAECQAILAERPAAAKRGDSPAPFPPPSDPDGPPAARGNGWASGYWDVSENNRKARYYAITKAGQKQLAREKQHWTSITAAVVKVMEGA